MSIISSLDSFLLDTELTIIEGRGGFPLIKIDNEYARAEISLYGAQLLSYKLKTINADNVKTTTDDLFFVSDLAYFAEGKAIKGGIPICWPWFGKDSDNPDKQMHGFARNMLWQLDKTSSLKNGETHLVLSLIDTEETRVLWAHEFKLLLDINIGKTLMLSLRTENTGESSFKITQALHAYFSVLDIQKTHIEGLNDVFYLDKVTASKEPILQQGAVSVDQEVDRIYTNTPTELTLLQKPSERKITIKSTGSKTAVIWNPWIIISKQSADLTDDAYRQFICVETANAADDFIVIEPNDSHTITAEYRAN